MRSSAWRQIFDALAHLGDAHQVAVVDVAVAGADDVELVGVVAAVRERAADVVVAAGRARDRPVEAPLVAVRQRDDADAARAIQPDRVLGDQRLVLVELAREAIEERRHRLLVAARDVLAQAADADVAREEAEAGEQLVEIHQNLALAERVEHAGDGADLHRVRAEPHQVAGQPLQLGDQHADVLHALRAPRCRAAAPPTGRRPGCWTAGRGNPSARRAGSPAATSSARRSSRCRCAGTRWSG